jgi:Flp pilus assembly protein TadG
MFEVSKRTPHRRAATIVEMALVISLVLPLMFAVFEYGRIIMLKQLMDNAAREGARRCP